MERVRKLNGEKKDKYVCNLIWPSNQFILVIIRQLAFSATPGKSNTPL
jgi:hypothetical protein